MNGRSLKMKKQGFTLIELLVVISVISILVGIAIPRFRGMQDEANQSKAEAELRVLQTAIESHYMNATPNAYPATSTTVVASDLDDDTPLIIGEALVDPFEGGTTEYNYILNDPYYVIFSTGPDSAADITGISAAGVLAGTNDDDIYASNGTGF